MSSPQRVSPEAETVGFPRSVPAYCAIVAVAVLVLAGVSLAAAVPSTDALRSADAVPSSGARPSTDAAGSGSNSSERLPEGQFRSPEQPTTPQPEVAPSAFYTRIGPNQPITPAVTKPDTGTAGHGGGGAVELALASTGGGQDAAWRAHARGILTAEHMESAPAASSPIRLLPLAGGLVLLGAPLTVVEVRNRNDDFAERDDSTERDDVTARRLH